MYISYRAIVLELGTLSLCFTFEFDSHLNLIQTHFKAAVLIQALPKLILNEHRAAPLHMYYWRCSNTVHEPNLILLDSITS